MPSLIRRPGCHSERTSTRKTGLHQRSKFHSLPIRPLRSRLGREAGSKASLKTLGRCRRMLTAKVRRAALRGNRKGAIGSKRWPKRQPCSCGPMVGLRERPCAIRSPRTSPWPLMQQKGRAPNLRRSTRTMIWAQSYATRERPSASGRTYLLASPSPSRAVRHMRTTTSSVII